MGFGCAADLAPRTARIDLARVFGKGCIEAELRSLIFSSNRGQYQDWMRYSLTQVSNKQTNKQTNKHLIKLHALSPY
ncbi:hypothetical protein HHUSO_G9604 [Huso huso]|uniref:Uncharacterized protein n=1 Tax=Huso huso TaxID=61971 RepID=A0ABR0ZTU6_HUSHU